MDMASVRQNVEAVANKWSSETATRLQRRALDPADFATLKDAGLTLTGVPGEMGGVWDSAERSTRPTGAIFRTLARIDPSVALEPVFS
jgi:alkylation response protein AidB-like acyl-CoA dehydrogenase